MEKEENTQGKDSETKEETGRSEDVRDHFKEVREELRISGDDILKFIRRVFRAGNSRQAVFENENGKKLFRINLFLLLLIFFFIPVIALIFLIVIIALDYSVSIEKKETKK